MDPPGVVGTVMNRLGVLGGTGLKATLGLGVNATLDLGVDGEAVGGAML